MVSGLIKPVIFGSFFSKKKEYQRKKNKTRLVRLSACSSNKQADKQAVKQAE